jgi:hypothetical protein
MDGFAGACVSLLSEDCTVWEDGCPSGQHCYSGPPESGCEVLDVHSAGVCVAD